MHCTVRIQKVSQLRCGTFLGLVVVTSGSSFLLAVDLRVVQAESDDPARQPVLLVGGGRGDRCGRGHLVRVRLERHPEGPSLTWKAVVVCN